MPTSWPEMHGALTHFPVALILISAFFETFAFLLKKEEWRKTSYLLLWMAVFLAIPTLISGWLTGQTLFGSAPQLPNIFVDHRFAAFTTTTLALITLIWRASRRENIAGGERIAALILLLITAGVVGYTGYLGGKMVFQGAEPIASITSPAHSASKLGAKQTAQSMDTLALQVIKQNNCQSCHRINGSGGSMGPDLTHEGRNNSDPQWQLKHLKNPSSVSPGSIMPPFDKLPPDQLKALAYYLANKK
jgi:mono/diheme cytochrome c family protein